MAHLHGTRTSLLLLMLMLTLMTLMKLSTGHKVKDHCWDNFLSCTMWSAEGTGMPYQSCSLRCRCNGFKSGYCEKVCSYEDYPYVCVCHHDFGSSTKPPNQRPIGCRAYEGSENIDEDNWRHKKIFPFW